MDIIVILALELYLLNNFCYQLQERISGLFLSLLEPTGLPTTHCHGPAEGADPRGPHQHRVHCLGQGHRTQPRTSKGLSSYRVPHGLEKII